MDSFYKKFTNQYLEALQILIEVAAIFRQYEKSHNSKIRKLPAITDIYYPIIKANNHQAKDKATKNGEIANRIELFIKSSSDLFFSKEEIKNESLNDGLKIKFIRYILKFIAPSFSLIKK